MTIDTPLGPAADDIIHQFIQANAAALKKQQEEHEKELKHHIRIPDYLDEKKSFVEGILKEAEKYLRRELYRLDELRENTRYGSTMGDGWYDWYGMVQDALTQTQAALNDLGMKFGWHEVSK